MSFTPAVADIPNTAPPTVGQTPDPLAGRSTHYLTKRRTITLKPNPEFASSKALKRLPRARKARARLRRQHKQRVNAARNN